MQKVQKFIDIKSKKDPCLVQAFIQNKEQTHGRILIPKAA